MSRSGHIQHTSTLWNPYTCRRRICISSNCSFLWHVWGTCRLRPPSGDPHSINIQSRSGQVPSDIWCRHSPSAYSSFPAAYWPSCRTWCSSENSFDLFAASAQRHSRGCLDSSSGNVNHTSDNWWFSPGRICYEYPSLSGDGLLRSRCRVLFGLDIPFCGSSGILFSACWPCSRSKWSSPPGNRVLCADSGSTAHIFENIFYIPSRLFDTKGCAPLPSPAVLTYSWFPSSQEDIRRT